MRLTEATEDYSELRAMVIAIPLSRRGAWAWAWSWAWSYPTHCHRKLRVRHAKVI